MAPGRLVVIVTGANSGVGYGTCCRLIEQLLHFNPPDASLVLSPKGIPNVISPYAGATELTLVVACRNPAAGRKTCRLLFKHAEKAVQWHKERGNNDVLAEKFLKNLKIDYLRLDLSSTDSIFSFAVEAYNRYTYISHLILNAGDLNIVGLFYPGYLIQLFAEGHINCVTYPNYFIQKKSTLNKDGFNNVWQINIFGHYCLYRRLEGLLRACPFEEARVQWSSSLDGFKHSFDRNDLQLLNTRNPYQPSKYQVNLVCAALSRLEETSEVKKGEAKLTHVPVHPGICCTNNTATVLNAFLVQVKRFAFYVARWMGSRNHPIDPHKGAVSNTVAALTSKNVLDELLWNPPRLLGARATFWGEEYVGFDNWEYEEHDASLLEKYLEEVYDGLPQVVTDNIGIAISSTAS